MHSSLTADPDNDTLPHSGFVPHNLWGTGPPVEIPAYHTHFVVLDSMDQQTGDTHYLLESNRGFLFHGHHSTVEWTEMKAIGGDGSEFASLSMIWIPADYLFPPCRPWMTTFSGDKDSAEVYKKGQVFLTQEKFTSDHHAGCMYQEVSRCELISKTSHPNLARYLGVETKVIAGEERVVRIAYQRYSMDLHNFVLMKRHLQPHHVDFIMQGIEDGMRHLHKLGLVHCDLRPMNVFVSIEEEKDDKDDNGHVVLKEVVVGDFDASVEIGDEISLKRASKDWWPTETEWGVKAGEWIDEWCLDKMGRWLKEDGLGIWDFANGATGSSSVGSLASAVMEAMPNHGW